MECVEDASMNDQQVIKVEVAVVFIVFLCVFVKALSVKTKELITNVQSLSDESDGSVTLNGLRQKKLNPSLETFLYNVASAEGLTQL